jgi:hypothetical protein
MSELVKRKDVVEALYEAIRTDLKGTFTDSMSLAIAMAENIPSVERKKGKWVEISWSEPDPNVCCTSYSIQSAKCSICGKYHTTPYLHSLNYFPYCPNCGAEMRDENE